MGKQLLILAIGAVLTGAPSRADTAPPLSHDFREVIAFARAKVQPAVLYLKCLLETTESGKLSAQSVSGSAFIISADGEFVTNWHVVNRARSIRCLLSDGRHFDADCLGSDKSMDLALCKMRLPPGQKVPFSRFGSSAKIGEGDFVIAIGAPWGLNRSVTFGTVSCARRYLEAHSEYILWIQTDASIGPGNSGGPLVNTEGEIVGVNALGSMLPTANFGFAIPADEATLILEQLRKHGKVNWSWCGLDLQARHDFERDIYFDATNGVIVAGTAPDSPARQAGVLARDRLVAINGTAVDGPNEESLPALRRWIGLLPDSEKIVLELVRDSQPLSLTISPRLKGKVEGLEREFPKWDFSAKTINSFENPELHLRKPKGVYVFGLVRPGNAERSDLREKDIIVAVNGRPVESLDDLAASHKQSLASADRRKALFTVLRNGKSRELILDFARDYQRE
jgi:serine protease Do